MSLARGLALLLAGAILGGVAMAAVYGAPDGVLTAGLLFLVGIAPLLASLVLVRSRARLGSLSAQLGAGVAVPIGLALIGIQVVALVLFVSAHDAFTLALLLGVAGVIAMASALALMRSVSADVGAVRELVGAVGRGERERRLELVERGELSELAEEVNRMTELLARAEAETERMARERGDLLVAISHDLRGPLASVRLLVDAIQDGIVEPSGQRRALTQIAYHVRSLESLIEDLFELSRIEAGDVDWHLEGVVLDELVEEAIEGLHGRAAARHVRLERSGDDRMTRVRANPEKLQRVLYNLIENALAHTPEDGRVTVAVLPPQDGAVEVDVADSGSGIAAEDRGRVFEPFFRGGPETARPRNGAGLGLPICRAIVEAHGGRIWVADAAEGTRMAFSLPVSEGTGELPADDVPGARRAPGRP